MKLTKEQQHILEVFNKGVDIKINAFAGAGKTTTLRMLAENNPDKKILLLAFNKKVVKDLEGAVTKNVKVQTTHSLAYGHTMKKFKRRTIKNDKDNISKIKETFGLNDTLAWMFVKIMEKYYNQSRMIDLPFLMKVFQEEPHLYLVFKEAGDSDFDFKKTLEILSKIWIMIESGELSMSHGYYLKYFQKHLDKFLPSMTRYDVIMLDEAQDTNPVVADFFSRLPGQKVVVGDKHQAIYGWRDAVNAMTLFDYEECYLSESFRFGDDIAKDADYILKEYKKETRTLHSFFGEINESNFPTKAIICRSNAGILRQIFSMDASTKIGFARGLELVFQDFLEMTRVREYYNSLDDSRLSNVSGFLYMLAKQHQTWSNFVDFISNVLNDRGLSIIIEIIMDFPVYAIYKKAKEMHALGDKNIDVMLGTAHTYKGLEFDEVTISTDFWDVKKMIAKIASSLDISKQKLKEMFLDETCHSKKGVRDIVEEINLIYVSITRAKYENNILSSAIRDILDNDLDYFFD